jgi:hypothetical protein
VGLTQGGAPWAILGRAFGAENQRQQKTANYQSVTGYPLQALSSAEVFAYFGRRLILHFFHCTLPAW